MRKVLDEMLIILPTFHHRRSPLTSSSSKDKDDEKTITTNSTPEEYSDDLIQPACSIVPSTSIFKKMTQLSTPHEYPVYMSKSSIRRGKRESNNDDLNTTYPTSKIKTNRMIQRSIPIIKQKSCCDDEVQSNEFFYDMATWRMYHRIQKHRKIKRRDDHSSSEQHHVVDETTSASAWDGINLCNTFIPKKSVDKENDDSDSAIYPIFQLDMDD